MQHATPLRTERSSIRWGRSGDGRSGRRRGTADAECVVTRRQWRGACRFRLGENRQRRNEGGRAARTQQHAIAGASLGGAAGTMRILSHALRGMRNTIRAARVRVQAERCAGRSRDPLQDQDTGEQQMDKDTFHDARFTLPPSDRPVDQLITVAGQGASEPNKRKSGNMTDCLFLHRRIEYVSPPISTRTE